MSGRDTRPYVALFVVLIVIAGACQPNGAGSETASPTITTRLALTLVGGAIKLNGSHFGTRSPGHAIVFRPASGAPIRLESTGSAIDAWLDTSIEFNLPQSASSGDLVVESPSGASRPVPLEVYGYEAFPVPPTPLTNASPLALAVDQSGRVWLNQEFHYDYLPLAVLEPGQRSLSLLAAPKPPGPGPFATRIFPPDQRTHITELGEDVLVDPGGAVWFSEGGGLLYDGTLPNHSRVVRYDPMAPAGKRFRVYNIPGDKNEVVGLAWDGKRGRLWVAQAGLVAGGSLLTFDPQLTPFDNGFDFSQPLGSLLHKVGDPDPAGYHVYPVAGADKAYPVHMLVRPDGSVWYTAYLGNAIGRLDPITGDVKLVPLSKPVGTSPTVRAFGSGGPFDILAAPDGSIVFNEQFDNAVVRLDSAHMRDLSACMHLDRGGANPCLRVVRAPGADLAGALIHSIAFDAAGRLWFTQHGPESGGTGLESVGFVAADWSVVVRLPPLPLGASTGPPANDGIAIDPERGDVWIAEYYRHVVGRLHRM